jgi:hypothetical protein
VYIDDDPDGGSIGPRGLRSPRGPRSCSDRWARSARVAGIHGCLVLQGLLAPPFAVAAQDATACKAITAPLPEAQRKFHPGHYVSMGKAGRGADISDVKAPGVVGVQIRYRWATLERDEGRYDFAPIARDLAAARRAGLQLVAMVEDKSFDHAIPTPGYLHEKRTLPTRNRGYIAVRWDPEVNDRFKRLIAALGAEFDCDPHFEGIAIQETAPSLDDSVLKAHGYTPEKYRDSLTGLLRSASGSLPSSRVFWYMNFLPGKQEYVGEVAQAVLGAGVVMGGPDVLPESQSLARMVYPLYGQFAGRMKLFGSMQHDSYRQRRTGGSTPGSSPYWSMDDMYRFARDRLHVDYLFWEYRTQREPTDSRGWEDAREVIARNPTFGGAGDR